jgi:hypothetical protein
MEAEMMFLDCPAHLDIPGARRCGLPAEVEDRYTAQSSDGPLECARIRCPRGHWFNGPLASLILVSPQAQTGPWGGLAARPGAAAANPGRRRPDVFGT